jgi:RNA polymerase sigma-70 factor (ECF subfamily)
MTRTAVETDESVIQAAIAAGDRRRAVQLLMETYGPAVFSFCCRIVRDRALAADVQQEVFVQAYRDLETWEQRASARSWLFGIAHHRSLDAIKARSRHGNRFVSDEEAGERSGVDVDPLPRLDAAVRARALEECLARLTPQARSAVLLRFQEELSYEELCALSGEKSDTVRARVVRTLPVLRACLAEKGIEA